jgi:tRNA A-37 threonylcarbamoyl transferase component Bud32
VLDDVRATARGRGGIVPSVPLEAGRLVAGKYRIVRLLGQGGMGSVYIAVNERLRKEVALKVLSDEVASDPQAAARFLREAMSASAVRHPGVVEIYDADADGGLLWIAMEKLQGESLADRIARGRLSTGEVFAIMTQVLSALAAVHAVGIIHRDLKPANIFIERAPTGEERVKILDFGIAKATFEGMDKVTRTGMTVGTRDYLAPEQAMARALDARTDLYAVGVILFEALTGTMPYDANSFGELVAKMIQEGPKDVAALVPELAPGIAHLVNACLSVDPNGRPPSASVLLDEMRRVAEVAPTAAFVHGAPPGGNMVMPSNVAPAPRSGMRPIVIAIGVASVALLMLVIGIGGLLWWSRSTSGDANTGAPAARSEPAARTERAADGRCEATTDCADPMRERCNLVSHTCERTPGWADTRIQYAGVPEIRLTNCYSCSAMVHRSQGPPRVTVSYQQGGGYTQWALTVPTGITVGRHELLEGSPTGAGPSMFVIENDPGLRVRYHGTWRVTAGTLEITSADIRDGGELSGRLRADVVNPNSMTGTFTTTFHVDLPE